MMRAPGTMGNGHGPPNGQPNGQPATVAAPPEPEGMGTLHEREILHYMGLVVGMDAVDAIGAKVTEIRRAWRIAMPQGKDAGKADKEALAAESRWHAFLHVRLQHGRATVDELNVQIAAVNELLPAKAERVRPLVLVSHAAQLAASRSEEVRAALLSELRSSLASGELRDELRGQLRDELRAELLPGLRADLTAELRMEVRAQVRAGELRAEQEAPK